MTNAKTELKIGDRYIVPWRGTKNDLALFAALGAAIAEVQSFEFHLISLLGIIDKPTDADKFYERTLGSLIKVLNRSIQDAEIVQVLEDVRNKRNRVVHSFLREYQWPMMSDNDYVCAIQDLETTRSFIERTGVELSRYLSDQALVDLVVVSINHETGEIDRLV